MGFRFSSFVAGAAENLTETLKEDEKQAATAATFGVKALKEQYDKVQAENRSLETELSKNVDYLRENDSTATEAQLFAAATNKTYMTAIMEAAKTNPGSFRVADVVKIKEANPSPQTAMEMIKAYTTIPAISQAARQAEGVAVPDKPQGLFGIGALRDRASSRAASKAEEQTAKAMGVSIDQLRAASGFKRPEIDAGATFDFTSMQKQPSNVKDITDKLEVSLVQAAQQFGENSNEYKKALEQITKVKTTVAGLEDNTDKSVDARAKRLRVQLLDTTDPAKRKQLQTDIDAAERSILQHNKATRVTEPKDKNVTYNAMKISVNDYVNTRMKEDKGVDWRQYVDFKTFTDPATNQVFTSRTQKAKLSTEQQQELFAIERKLTAQSLRDNGYVLQDGTPRTPVAEELMRNFNISAADLSTQPPAQTAPSKAAATPAAQPVKPAAAPTPPQLTRQDQEALVWANTPANAGPKADAIKKKIQNKINGVN